MKKLLSLVLVLALSLSFVACSSDKGTMTGMANPNKDVDSLAELNELEGTSIKAYDGEDLSEEHFIYIDGSELKISEYRFVANDVTYTLRAAKTEEDISGVYLTDFEDGTMGDTISEKEVMPTETADGFVWARWYDGDIQYLLEADNVTLEDFSNVFTIVR